MSQLQQQFIRIHTLYSILFSLISCAEQINVFLNDTLYRSQPSSLCTCLAFRMLIVWRNIRLVSHCFSYRNTNNHIAPKQHSITILSASVSYAQRRQRLPDNRTYYFFLPNTYCAFPWLWSTEPPYISCDICHRPSYSILYQGLNNTFFIQVTTNNSCQPVRRLSPKLKHDRKVRQMCLLLFSSNILVREDINREVTICTSSVLTNSRRDTTWCRNLMSCSFSRMSGQLSLKGFLNYDTPNSFVDLYYTFKVSWNFLRNLQTSKWTYSFYR